LAIRKQNKRFISALAHNPSGFTKLLIAGDSTVAQGRYWLSQSAKPRAWEERHASGVTNKKTEILLTFRHYWS